MPLLVGGDSLTRNYGGFYFPPQTVSRAILLREPSFHNIVANNEWKRGESFAVVPSGYPVWQSMLPITRLQQLSIGSKHPIAEKCKSLPYPTLIPITTFNNPLVPSTKISKFWNGPNSGTNQGFILPTELQGNVSLLSKNNTEKLGDQHRQEPAIKHINNLKLPTQNPDTSKEIPASLTPRLTQLALQLQAKSTDKSDQNEHNNGTLQEISDLPRKRSSSWPVDMQLKKKFLKRSKDAQIVHSYKNLEMDVANILVSDIPIAVVGLNALKENSTASQLVVECKQHSSDSSVEVDSDNSSHSDRENCYTNKGKPGMVGFTCQQCAVTCESTEDLISHNAKHATNSKPGGETICNFTFTCNVCSQVFRSTNGLQKHVEFHADDDHRYNCSFCFQPFGNKDGLEEHIINTHMSKRPHKCTYCPKAFRDPGSLQKHIRVHTGEKPYQCNACEKSFAEYSSLRKHLRVHTGEQPYKCKFCPKAFSISGNLQRHILIHTGERPYKCSDCSKAFNNPSHLRRHIKNLHSKLETQK